jgi:hypothetical protein
MHGPRIRSIIVGSLSLYFGEAEQVAVEGYGELAGGDIVHETRGADEIRDAAMEELFGETRASPTERISERSGVIPDSQALEKTKLGTRSIRLSSCESVALHHHGLE